MRDLVVEALVHGDELLRLGVHAVHGDVDVPVVRVAVERIDGLVLGEAHLVEKHPDRLVGLCGRRLLVFPPAQDPVLDGLRAALGDLGEIDHLLDLAVVVDVEEVERPPVLDLLAVATGPRPGDVVDEGAHVERPCSWARAFFEVATFLTITAPLPQLAGEPRMAACSASRAAAVSRL